MLLWSRVPLFPRHQWALGLVSLVILAGVQFQPQTALREAPTAPKSKVVCQVASAPQVSESEQCPFQAQEPLVFGGIGAYLSADVQNDNRVTIVQPLEGTPAADANLQSGDVIEEIDGREVQGMPLEEAVSMIRGTEGTVVHLGIYRPASEERFELDITRATIHTPENGPVPGR